MNSILKLAIALGGALWDEYKIRKAKEKAHANSPRSSTLIQCGKCGKDVRADELSMMEHQRVCKPTQA